MNGSSLSTSASGTPRKVRAPAQHFHRDVDARAGRARAARANSLRCRRPTIRPRSHGFVERRLMRGQSSVVRSAWDLKPLLAASVGVSP